MRWSEAGYLSQIVLTHAPRQVSVSLILGVRQKMSPPFNLPKEAVRFLSSDHQLKYDPSLCEPGAVMLHRLADLRLGEVWVGTDSADDPNYSRDGYYAIPAVSLSCECTSYSPEFILLWLPNERLFGTWDCDHWSLTVFESATWADIVARPHIYLGAQWDCASVVGSVFRPWRGYPFRAGSPFD